MVVATTAVLIGTLIHGESTAAALAAQGTAAFYDAGQASRGKAVFERSCRKCHTVGAATAPVRAGDPIPLVGTAFFSKWHTAGDLFSKTRSTMPADAQGRLSIGETLDVIAFMLQVNGVAAGKTPLPGQLDKLHQLPLDRVDQAETAPNDLRAAGFYTEAQAKRGESYFSGHCRTCHSIINGPPTPADLAMGYRGVLLADEYRLLPMATGASRWQRYPDVYSLFNKIRRSMPGHDPGALSLRTYLDLTAYVLKINGAPAGNDELGYSEHVMKSMMTNEPAFERLFNGKDLTGIKFVVGMNCRVAIAGCQQQESGRPFKVENGLIMTTGNGQGYWYADTKYLDFTLRFDVRFPSPPDVHEVRDVMVNGGYFLFVTEHQVWPRMLQLEGGFGSFLTPAPLGAKAEFTVDAEARRRAMRPLNEWNSVEIVSKNGQVIGWLNGTQIATVRSHEFTAPGYIGFQSEAGEIQWRNIRIRAE